MKGRDLKGLNKTLDDSKEIPIYDQMENLCTALHICLESEEGDEEKVIKALKSMPTLCMMLAAAVMAGSKNNGNFYENMKKDIAKTNERMRLFDDKSDN